MLQKTKSQYSNRLYSIRNLQQSMSTGDIEARNVVESFYREMERNRHLNIYITETIEFARRRAEESDERLRAGNSRPLEGIPIAVKDNFCTQNILTTAGSKMLHNFVPTYESTVTQKLWDAGAILLGKTNLDEFAMGSSTETSYFGPTINPVGKGLGFDNLTPGGSSGGSAAAVAGGLAAGAIGSDTGGSIRQPASFCGIVGMKPTYGLCSRWGIAAYASSLDQAGAFGKTVEDVAILMDVIIGEDEKDTTSCAYDGISLVSAISSPPKSLKIAIPQELREMDSTYETELVWHKAEELSQKLGHQIVEVSMPNLKYALPAYYIIALSEASSNLARYDGVKYGYRASAIDNIEEMYSRTRAEGFGSEALRRILLGTFSLSSGYYDAYYKRAQQVRRLVSNEFDSAFSSADLMLMPTAPTGAFENGASIEDPLQMYLEDVFTVPVNLAGLPACTLPVANDKRGMPLGMQVIGPRFSDHKVLKLAANLEDELAESGG